MGQITSVLARPFRNYNIDNRAAKVLERRQKVAEPAPHHPTTVEILSRFKAEHPEFLDAQKQKHEKLDTFLKKVYVESTGTLPQLETSKSNPVNRKPPPETDMGSLEATSDIPEGRIGLKTVFTFLAEHRSDPEKFTAARIAKEYKLDEKDVENVLHYFKILQLFIPKSAYERNKNLKKLVAKQMEAASSVASPFLLPKIDVDADKSKKDVAADKSKNDVPQTTR